MKKFLVIYQASAEAVEQVLKATPEQKEAQVKPWMDWKSKAGDAVLDLGTPVLPGFAMGKDGSATASTSEVSGFSIIQAENMEKAQGLLTDHPHNDATNGLKIEVHECVSL